MTSTHPYTVPVIAGDLRRAELVKQFADTFDYLDSVSQDMLNRIAIRLNVYRTQLNKFDERIQHANAHVERIKGSKRAIQVHSSARYPVEQNRSTYKSIFECDPDSQSSVLHYNSFYLNETVDKFIDPNDKESKSNDDTLIVLKQYENNFIQKTKKPIVNGLGRAPMNIKSVISFLKYNTQENPYIQATKIDPLNVGDRKRKQIDEPVQSGIVETPLPDFYQRVSKRPATGNIGYNPILDRVPPLILSENLPGLDNCVTFDDNTAMDWTKLQMTSIAPSLANSILPDINDSSSTTTTFLPVEPPKTIVPAPPPVSMPEIIPLIAGPPPSFPSPAPSLSPTNPSDLISLSHAGESQASPVDQLQASTVNQLNDGDNSFLEEILGFQKKDKLKPIPESKPNSVDRTRTRSSNKEKTITDMLREHLENRRKFISDESPLSSAAPIEKPIVAPTRPLSSSVAHIEKPIAAPTRSPSSSTGCTFIDAIAARAQEIAAEQQRRKDESDNDNDDDEDW